MKGEQRVFEVIFEGKANIFLEPQENPFRAVTHYHEEGKKETSWSCSSTSFYGIKGWKEEVKALTAKEMREKLKTNTVKNLINELLFYANTGGSL